MTIEVTRDMLAHATAQYKAAQAAITGISNEFSVDEKGNFTVTTEQNRNYRKAVSEAKEAKEFLEAVQLEQKMAAWEIEPAYDAVAASDAGNYGAQEAKSLADVFLESDSYRALQAKAVGGRLDHVSFGDVSGVGGSYEGKSIFALTAGSHTRPALGGGKNVGITERPLRKMRIRDLFPKSTTSDFVVYGVVETGWTNNAGFVRQRMAANGTDAPTGAANGGNGYGSATPLTGGTTDVWGTAPTSSIQMAPQLFPVGEIAHLIPAHKNILADEPRLRSFLNTRMVDGVKYAEDFHLLQGTAGPERVTGLFNTPGIQTYTGLNTDKYSGQVRRAITRAMLAEYDPTGLVISPTVWEELELEEDDYGAYRIAVNVAVGATKRLWTLDVVATTAMVDDKFLIGAFGMGATIHDRETVRVSVSTEHANAFAQGIVWMRAEERLALEVNRPESFVLATWTDPV